MISETEKERRRRAVASSEGSLAMEGQHLDSVTRELNARYVAGELTLEEFSRGIELHVAALAESLREEHSAISA